MCGACRRNADKVPISKNGVSKVVVNQEHIVFVGEFHGNREAHGFLYDFDHAARSEADEVGTDELHIFTIPPELSVFSAP